MTSAISDKGYVISQENLTTIARILRVAFLPVTEKGDKSYVIGEKPEESGQLASLRAPAYHLSLTPYRCYRSFLWVNFRAFRPT